MIIIRKINNNIAIEVGDSSEVNDVIIAVYIIYVFIKSPSTGPRGAHVQYTNATSSMKLLETLVR